MVYHKYSKKKKNNITQHKLIVCRWKYKNTKNFRFSKLMWYLNHKVLVKDCIGQLRNNTCCKHKSILKWRHSIQCLMKEIMKAPKCV